MKLSDNLAIQKYTLPAGTTIAPYGVLRIWCDEDGTQGPLHANFKLSASGELVALWDATGTVLHEVVEFGPQTADVSTGRLFDGGLPWVTFPNPTYLARNELAGCGQRSYGALAKNTHGVALAAAGTLQVGTTIGYGVSNGPAGGVGIGALALGGAHLDVSGLGLGNEVLLLELPSLGLLTTLLLDGTGAAAWTLPLPSNPGLAGVRLFAQAFTLGSGWDSSRAIEATICP
jgi:hypothetical protein